MPEQAQTPAPQLVQTLGQMVEQSALTLVAAAMVGTVQVVPEELGQPVQLLKALLAPWANLRVTVLPREKTALHGLLDEPVLQLMPLGVETTLPSPSPVMLTEIHSLLSRKATSTVRPAEAVT